VINSSAGELSPITRAVPGGAGEAGASGRGGGTSGSAAGGEERGTGLPALAGRARRRL